MFTLRSAAVVSGLSVASLLAGGGCKGTMGGGDADGGSTSGVAYLSNDQLAEQGNSMVAKGNAMQDTAAKLPDGGSQNGLSKEYLLAEGKKLIARGEALLARAKGT